MLYMLVCYLYFSEEMLSYEAARWAINRINNNNYINGIQMGRSKLFSLLKTSFISSAYIINTEGGYSIPGKPGTFVSYTLLACLFQRKSQAIVIARLLPSFSCKNFNVA